MFPFLPRKYLYNYCNPLGIRYKGYEAPEAPLKEIHSLKVITYNIKFARKIPEAIAILQHRNLQGADIICLQEMDAKGVQQIAKILHYNFVYYPAMIHPYLKQNFGNAILSKWPIIHDEKVQLPLQHPHQWQRIAVCAEIKIVSYSLRVYSTHISVFIPPLQRRAMIQKLIDHVPVDKPHCLIAGDFNTFRKTDYHAVLFPLQQKGFTSATENVGFSYTHWYFFNKKSLLDHIFVKGMTMLHSGNLEDTQASDHLPVWSELEFLNAANHHSAQIYPQ